MNYGGRPFGRCNNAGRTPSEVVRHFSPHLFEHPGQFLDARGSGTGTRCPVRQNDRAKKLGDRKIGKVSRLWRTRATMTESRVMRRIVETQRQESRDGDSRNPKILALAWSMEVESIRFRQHREPYPSAVRGAQDWHSPAPQVVDWNLPLSDKVWHGYRGTNGSLLGYPSGLNWAAIKSRRDRTVVVVRARESLAQGEGL